MTPQLDQSRAPFWEALTGYVRTGIYPLHTPGHKGGRFTAPELATLVGSEGLALDLPAMTATDNMFHPTGPVRDAQRLAAELYGAGETFYLTAGSTIGIAAALLATVPEGATVALARNIHRSVVAGLVLCGGRPRFIKQEMLAECGALPVTVAAVAAALDTDPRPAAVLLTRPSYYGLAGELTEITAFCHERRVPLIVDEAHGGHFQFLPSGFVQPALAAGADLVVQSCHKTLGSLVGSAQLHVGCDSMVDAERVRDALGVLQTTSPSYLLLASLDVVRRHLALHGRELFATAVAKAAELERAIDALPRLEVLRPETGTGCDPLRLVVNVSDTGWTGYEVEKYLRSEFRVEDEMADGLSVVYVLSPNDDPTARDRLIAGLTAVSEQPKQETANRTALGRLLRPIDGEFATTPRSAALGCKTDVRLEAAAGRTCAEMVMFYPPGIPLLMPGQRIEQATLDQCQALWEAGAHPYASDPSLSTIRVVDE